MDLYSLHGFEFGFGLEMINRLGLEFCFCLGVDWMLDFTLYLDLDWGLDFSYKWTRIQVQESESTQLIMATLLDPPVLPVPRLQGLSCRNSYCYYCCCYCGSLTKIQNPIAITQPSFEQQIIQLIIQLDLSTHLLIKTGHSFHKDLFPFLVGLGIRYNIPDQTKNVDIRIGK